MQKLDLNQYISVADREDLERIKKSIAKSSLKHGRNKSVANFKSILEILKKFCTVAGKMDGNKCLACGICFLSDTEIATSASVLKDIFGFSKANINILFNECGFKNVEKTINYQRQLLDAIPVLKTKAFIAKQWSIRRKAPTKVSLAKEEEIACNKCEEIEKNCAPKTINPSSPEDESDKNEFNEMFKCPCCHPIFGCTCGIFDLSTLIRPDGTFIHRECRCKFNPYADLDSETCKCCHVEWK